MLESFRQRIAHSRWKRNVWARRYRVYWPKIAWSSDHLLCCISLDDCIHGVKRYGQPSDEQTRVHLEKKHQGWDERQWTLTSRCQLFGSGTQLEEYLILQQRSISWYMFFMKEVQCTRIGWMIKKASLTMDMWPKWLSPVSTCSLDT